MVKEQAGTFEGMEKKEEDEESSSVELFREKQQGFLDSRYQLKLESEIHDLSSEFAKACAIIDVQNTQSSDSLYAIVFSENFPAPTSKIEKLKKNTNPHITDIIDSGIVNLQATGAQRHVVVLKRPEGQKLSELLKEQAAFDEKFILDTTVEQLTSLFEYLSDLHIIHGNINLDTIYVNQADGSMIVKECISEFSGFSQKPVFECMDRIVCHVAGKGDSDFSADYYALGMVVSSLLLGKELFADMGVEDVIATRFENGSYNMVKDQSIAIMRREFSQRITNLLKGLLNDFSVDRWQGGEVISWVRKLDNLAPPVSKIHKQAQTALIFEDKEYLSRKHLARDISRKWNVAKTSLKLTDLARWVNLALKKPDVGEQIEGLVSNKSSDVILSDDKIFNVITILDPDGPIRYKEVAVNIFGLGTFLAFSYIKGERDFVQNIGSIINESMIDYWIRHQTDPDYYSYSTLTWSPVKIRQYVKKKDLGFGMERCLYELNRTLSCQSPIMGNNYVDNLTQLLNVIDKKSESRTEEEDPVDRHIAAFIATKVNLLEDIRIKNLQNFPQIARNPHVIMVGLLAVAQSSSQARKLNGITSWMNERLSTLVDSLHSRLIKRDIKSKLKQASKDGSVNSLFKIISSPIYAKRDVYGFREAKMQYIALAREIIKLKTQSNIERMAYKIGLKIAVTISYLVCTITMLFVLLQQT